MLFLRLRLLKMKNKFLIGSVTFFVAMSLCIFFFNVSDSSTKKKYYFNRKFSGDSILKFDKKFNKLNEGEYVMYVRSDSCLIERDKVEISKSKDQYKFYFFDFKFENKSIKEAILPSSSYLLFYASNKIFYSLKFNLFAYDFRLRNSKEIRIDSFKVFNIKLLPGSGSKFLCLGEYLIDDKYVTGFYVVDINSKEIELIKGMQFNYKSKILENFLIFSGDFSNNFEGNEMAFFCDKYSKIYFFNNNGGYVKELNTKENVPLPKILTNDKGDNFYSRGDTWSTNRGVFFNKESIFVFSGRSEFETNIVVDEYSFKNLKYNKSYRLNYNNYDSKSIANVNVNKENVIIAFNSDYASFKLKINGY